jgi:hypothetical protein
MNAVGAGQGQSPVSRYYYVTFFALSGHMMDFSPNLLETEDATE